jgi:hypothetical protein
LVWAWSLGEDWDIAIIAKTTATPNVHHSWARLGRSSSIKRFLFRAFAIV